MSSWEIFFFFFYMHNPSQKIFCRYFVSRHKVSSSVTKRTDEWHRPGIGFKPLCDWKRWLNATTSHTITKRLARLLFLTLSLSKRLLRNGYGAERRMCLQRFCVWFLIWQFFITACNHVQSAVWTERFGGRWRFSEKTVHLFWKMW